MEDTTKRQRKRGDPIACPACSGDALNDRGSVRGSVLWVRYCTCLVCSHRFALKVPVRKAKKVP
jgi:hypothetical protein